MNTLSVVDKQSEFKGYSGGTQNQNMPRGFTKVNNILHRLENFSDLDKDFNDPAAFSDGLSELNGTIEQSRRGTTKSNNDAFLSLIRDSRNLIQDLNKMEDEMIDQANRDDDATDKHLPTIEELKDGGGSIIDPNDRQY